MMLYFFLAFVGFMAAFVQTSIGFGSGIIMMNILPYLIVPYQAQIICLFTCIVLASSLVIRTYRSIRFAVMLPLVVPALVCALICSRLSVNVEVHTARILLGALFVVLSVYFLSIASRLKFKPSIPLALCTGLLSGVMNGFFTMGGPPAVLYMAPSIDDKKEYLATTQSYFLVLNIASLFMRVKSAGLQGTTFWMIATCCFGALGGTVIGYLFVNKINAAVLKKFVYVFIGINGIIIALNEILAQ